MPNAKSPQSQSGQQRRPSTNAGPAATQDQGVPKPESSSEYEGAPNRKPGSNPGAEVKTETSSSSGE